MLRVDSLRLSLSSLTGSWIEDPLTSPRNDRKVTQIVGPPYLCACRGRASMHFPVLSFRWRMFPSGHGCAASDGQFFVLLHACIFRNWLSLLFVCRVSVVVGCWTCKLAMRNGASGVVWCFRAVSSSSSSLFLCNIVHWAPL